MTSRTPGWVRRGLAFVLWIGGFVVLFQLAMTVTRVVVWRTRWRPGIEFFRRYNKLVENPAALKVAGQPGERMTAIHHKGRKSGRAYVTPVWAERVGPSFYIQLPYGSDVDWCKNVMADDGCAIEHDGVRYDTAAPAILPAAHAVPLLPPGLRRMHRLAGVDSYLRLDILPVEEPGKEAG